MRGSNLDGVLQLTWDEVLGWIYDRFVEYSSQKKDHPQWEWTGKSLFNSACGKFRKNRDGYVQHWLKKMAGSGQRG